MWPVSATLLIHELNPLELCDALHGTVSRYLATALPIAERRAPALAHEFRRQLAAEKLVSGPFLESLPDFEKEGSLLELLEQGLLSPAWQRMEQTGAEALLLRQLHRHQSRALALARAGKNYLVATGTGSGKTESFLYPLVDHLLRDPDLATPGVRAILVYPMNALANDQLYYRIAPLLLRHLGDPGITFGRYTGQVRSDAKRENEERALLDNRQLMTALGMSGAHSIPESWRLTRQEMLDKPPHILVTNYAMLEHLLLLPRNRPLFDVARLKFIVLDEIHTYAGAQAIEVAFLLRKLKHRLGLPPGRVQCIGTSASLDQERTAALLEFSGALFGETFDDIVTGARLLHPALMEPPVVPAQPPEFWHRAQQALLAVREEPTSEQVQRWNRACAQGGLEVLQVPGTAPVLGPQLVEILRACADVQAVARILEDGLQAFDTVAARSFPSADHTARLDALRGIVALGVFARPAPDETPVLPARYHLAARGIDGAVLRLDSEAPEGWRDLRMAASHRDASGVPYFRLMVCRNCGEPYLEAWQSAAGGALHDHPKGKDRRVLLRFPGAGNLEALDEELDRDTDGDDAALTDDPVAHVHATRGTIEAAAATGTVALLQVALRTDVDEGRDYLPRCRACGTTASRHPEPITPMTTGGDALSAVVTQELLEALPPAGEDLHAEAMLSGRKLLAFSDNRQDAAFFAPYFERTSFDAALRGAIVRVLGEHGSLKLDELAPEVTRVLRAEQGGALAFYEDRVLEPISKALISSLMLGHVVAAFATPGMQRVSLEGLGLVRVDYAAQPFGRIVSSLVEVGVARLAGAEQALARFILDTMRRNRAVSPLGTMDLHDDRVWGEWAERGEPGYVLETPPGNKAGVLGVLSRSKTLNRFGWLLVEGLGITAQEAEQLLGAFWSSATAPGGLLVPNVKRDRWVIDLKQVTVRAIGSDVSYECERCGTWSAYSVGGICTRWKCGGAMSNRDAKAHEARWSRNHYAARYRGGRALPAYAVSREHTAVIDVKEREDLETAFKEGRVNLLSCTTTMELGVDLGDLEAVVCRNVPPGIANYQQRAGRAGRRAQAAPVAVTVAQGSRYDQETFRRFDGYLRERPRVPFVALGNHEFFKRHQTSVVLSAFLHHRLAHLGKTGAPTLKDLLGDRLTREEEEVFIGAVAQWFDSPAGREAVQSASRLVDTLDPALQSNGLQDAELREHVQAHVEELVARIGDDWRAYEERLQKHLDERKVSIAAAIQRDQERLLKQRLVDVLSRMGIIPTYSFPVHSVRLEVTSSRGGTDNSWDRGGLALERDAQQGIREYAPAAEVVAGGRVWTSDGIVRERDQYQPVRHYYICPDCRHVGTAIDFESLPNECRQCQRPIEHKQRRRFLEPRRFRTSYEDKKGRDPGSTRIKERALEEARLLTYAPLGWFADTDLRGVRTFFAPAARHLAIRDNAAEETGTVQGQLMVVNQGPRKAGYLRCRKCDYASPVPMGAEFGRRTAKQHKNPRTGDTCPEKELLNPVDLAHLFFTDIRWLYFARPIPPAADPQQREDHTERFARTLAEVLRLAATQQLQTDARDLRATFQLQDGYPLVVLYDNVSGGAGYVVRLCGDGSAGTAANLVDTALAILDCQCAASCGRCLQDYSNQGWWDKLDRVPVLEWLRAIRRETVSPEGVAPAGAVQWHAPSMDGLRDRLKGARVLHLVLPELVGRSENAEAALGIARWIRNFTEAVKDRQVHIHVRSGLPLSMDKVPSDAIAALLQLAELEYEGSVIFHRAKGSDQPTPRLLAEAQGQLDGYFTDAGSVSLLDGLLPGAMFVCSVSPVGASEHELTKDFTRLVKSPVEPKALAGLRANTRVFDFPVLHGQVRDVSKAFASLRGQAIDLLELHDPYLLRQSDARRRAAAFVAMLVELTGSAPRSLRLVWRRSTQKEGSKYLQQHEEAQARQEFETALKQAGVKLSALKIEWRPQTGEQRADFHDRRLNAYLPTGNGPAVRRWDISAGFGNLMDGSKECVVYEITG